jgi:NAD(P)-dependent dehydrogenase (short-subunit alcohol dehydrogenase family)
MPWRPTWLLPSFGEQAYAYGPSKAALHQLSRILARELVSQHIGNHEQALAEDTALIPMKRWGREEEMAALAISLASTAGIYMTGNIIPLDGGFSL